MTEAQKKTFKDHHKARTILLNAISYAEYEKITDKDTAKSIFDSLQMTHEGNSQVKETNALALIQKYEAFRMEEEESVETMFSRFQMLDAGLRVLDKGYSTADHVEKIIRSLPVKWRPMVTALKVAKDLNQISLEKLISSLRSHEIELLEDEPQRRNKSVALASTSRKTKALPVEEESEASDEDSEEDELSLISRRINHLWKHRQGKKFHKGPRSSKGKFESTSSQKRLIDKTITCFECKEPGHFKSECPKLKNDRRPKRFDKKKGLMATWDDSESEEEDSDDEQAAIALMAIKEAASEADSSSEDDSDSDEENEVLSSFTSSELKASLLEMMEKYNHLLGKHKVLKKKSVITSEASERKELIISELNEKNFSLNSSNLFLKSKISKLEEEINSSMSNLDNETKYEKSFQYFLARNINRSKMASLIYGVSRNNMKGLGFSESFDERETSNTKPKALYEHFVPSGTHIRSSEYVHSKGKQPQKKNKFSRTKRVHDYSKIKTPRTFRSSGGANKKGPRIWVPKDKIIYVADILSSSIKTPIMVPGQWMFATQDGRKAYVPRTGT